MGCFGLYFIWIAVNEAQINMARAGMGIFTTVFGSGLLVLLLYMFTKLGLWDKLGLPKPPTPKEAPAAAAELKPVG